MMRDQKTACILALCGFLVAGPTACAQAQTASADRLQQRMIERRAVEAVIWGMPAVNYDLMLQEIIKQDAGAAK